MAIDYRLVGKRIKEARLKKGYTQENMAELLKVSVAYVSRIETGKTRLNLKRLNQICDLLDTTEAYALNGVSDNSKTYLNNEISSVLKDCSSDDKELIYKIAAIISNKNKK